MSQQLVSDTQSAAQSAISNRRWWILIAIVFATLWLATLGMRKLLNPDEGRYAEIPREMVASGDWLTPRLNDLKYLEKPPLQYWATAVAYKAFGQNEFTARLWPGLTGLAGVFVAIWIGMKLFGRTAGLAAGAVLASCFMYTILGHVNTLDMGLSFFLQIPVGAFLLAQRADPGSKSERNFMLLAWASAALAVLSKGIVSMALPTLTLIVYTLTEREYSAWRRLHIAFGLPLFLIIAAPWFIAVSIANPGFATFFFVHEHLLRFLTDGANRVEPWWYFIPLLLIGALPWTGLAIAATGNAWRHESVTQADGLHSSFRSRRFLILWIVSILLFFTLSHSKLPPYIVPVFPALALLVGDYVARASNEIVGKHLSGIAVFWLLAAGYATLAPLPLRFDVPPESFREVFRWAGAGFVAATIGAVCAAVLARRHRPVLALTSAGFTAFLALSVFLLDFDVLRQLRSGYDLAQRIEPVLSNDKPLYSVQVFDHSLSFYLRKPVTLVDYHGELIFGQQLEPNKSVASLKLFSRIWQNDPSGAVAIMNRAAYDHFSAESLPMTVIEHGLQLTVVKKP